MATSILLEDSIEIPTFASLKDFRRWARSDEFPERGRIDFIDGRIEVDMAAENLFYHGTPKLEFTVVIGARVKEQARAFLFVDRTRISSPGANLSVEPDLALVTFDAVDSGRVRLVPTAAAKPDDFVEIEGAPELVAEFVSDSSVGKDTRRLPVAYYAAGVQEYWLVDVREGVDFRIYIRGEEGFEQVVPDADGFLYSSILNRRYRLSREQTPVGGWLYDLEEAEP